MIFSVLHLVLTLRALLRSVSDRFLFGIVGGLLRAALMVGGTVISFKQMALVMLPGLPPFTLKPSSADHPSSLLSLALLLIGVLGPVVSFAVLWNAYRRYHDVPAAEEERLQRPFSAWLLVGILDAMYVVSTVAAMAISEP